MHKRKKQEINQVEQDIKRNAEEKGVQENIDTKEKVAVKRLASSLLTSFSQVLSLSLSLVPSQIKTMSKFAE